MAVYVDELMDWKVVAEERNLPGRYWCHLTADSTSELHAFADRLGLRRAWFQDHVRPELHHYDLTAGMRAKALRMGAEFVSGMDQARRNVKAWRERESRSAGKLDETVTKEIHYP